jgi:hypothetical protein
MLGRAVHRELLEAMRAMKWIETEEFAPDLAYLEEIDEQGLVDDWLLINPQQRRASHELPSVGHRALFLRQRRVGRKGRFGVISESKHRPAALRIAGARKSYGDAIIDALAEPRVGAALLYPVVESVELTEPGRKPSERDVTIAVVLVAPASALGANQQVLKFVVKNMLLEDEPVVDAEGQT